MKQRHKGTSNQLCSPWFLLVFFCYYVPFWGGTFWFFSRMPSDAAVPLTTFFDWVAFFAIVFVWMGIGLGGIVVAAFIGEALRQVFGKGHLKGHLQIDEGDQHWDDEFDDSWYMLDSGDELLDVRSVDSFLVVQDGFEKPASSVIVIDESESVVNNLLPDEVGVG
jgi:hypothetical protein